MRLITICHNISNSVFKEDYEFWIKMREVWYNNGGEEVDKEIEANRDWLDYFEEEEGK